MSPNKTLLKPHHLELFTLIVVSLAIATILGPMLPDMYIADSRIIAARINGAAFSAFGSSFTNTAAFYKLFGVSDATPQLLLSSFNLGWAWLGVALAIPPRTFGLSVKRLALIAGMSIPLGVFLYPLTKEVTAIFVAALILWSWRSQRSSRAMFIGLLLIVAYGIFFRTYWLGVAAISMVLLVFTRSRLSNSALAVVSTPVLLVGYWLGVKAFGEPFASVREQLNEVGTRAIDTGSLITNPISADGTLADLANTLIVWITSMFPVPMLLSGDMLQTGYAIFQLVLSVLIFRAVAVVAVTRRYRFKAAYELQFLTVVVIAYTLTQALFEPDYGSIARHRVFAYILVLRITYLVTYIQSALSPTTRATLFRRPKYWGGAPEPTRAARALQE